MVCAADIKQKGLRQLRLLTHHVDEWGMTVLRWCGHWRHTSDDDDTWWWLYCVVDETMTTRGREQHVRDVCTAEFPKHVVDDCTANDDGTRGWEWHVVECGTDLQQWRCGRERRDDENFGLTVGPIWGWTGKEIRPPDVSGVDETTTMTTRTRRQKFGLKGIQNSAKVR